MKTYIVKRPNEFDRTYSCELRAIYFAAAWVGENSTHRREGNDILFFGEDGSEAIVTSRIDG